MLSISVNDIVLVDSHVGYVRYIGPMYNSCENSVTTEMFVGLELVEATGNNDGSVNGTRYFSTESGQNYGLLVPQSSVERILTGWDLLKKIREQHTLLLNVAKHWNDSISALDKCHEHISELESRLASQENFYGCEEQEHMPPQKPTPTKIRISPPVDSRIEIPIATPVETPNGSDSLYDDRPVGFQPREEYSFERFSQASQATNVPTIPPYTPQESFRSDASAVSSLSGWEYLEQWRSKATTDGVLPALTSDNSAPLASIPENDIDNTSIAASSYYIDAPQHIRFNDQRSFNSSFSDLNSSYSDNVNSEASPEFSVIWGVLSPT